MEAQERAPLDTPRYPHTDTVLHLLRSLPFAQARTLFENTIVLCMDYAQSETVAEMHAAIVPGQKGRES